MNVKFRKRLSFAATMVAALTSAIWLVLAVRMEHYQWARAGLPGALRTSMFALVLVTFVAVMTRLLIDMPRWTDDR